MKKCPFVAVITLLLMLPCFSWLGVAWLPRIERRDRWSHRIHHEAYGIGGQHIQHACRRSRSLHLHRYYPVRVLQRHGLPRLHDGWLHFSLGRSSSRNLWSFGWNACWQVHTIHTIKGNLSSYTLAGLGKCSVSVPTKKTVEYVLCKRMVECNTQSTTLRLLCNWQITG